MITMSGTGDHDERYSALPGCDDADLRAVRGAFECNFEIAKVLLGDDRINHVFTIAFPDRSTRERFFADKGYLAVRERFYEPAVASATVLVELGSWTPEGSEAHRPHSQVAGCTAMSFCPQVLACPAS